MGIKRTRPFEQSLLNKGKFDQFSFSIAAELREKPNATNIMLQAAAKILTSSPSPITVNHPWLHSFLNLLRQSFVLFLIIFVFYTVGFYVSDNAPWLQQGRIEICFDSGKFGRLVFFLFEERLWPVLRVHHMDPETALHKSHQRKVFTYDRKD